VAAKREQAETKRVDEAPQRPRSSQKKKKGKEKEIERRFTRGDPATDSNWIRENIIINYRNSSAGKRSGTYRAYKPVTRNWNDPWSDPGQFFSLERTLAHYERVLLNIRLL